MKRRILQLTNSFHLGGSERQALDLFRLLHSTGKYEMHLASLSPDGVLRLEVEAMGIGKIHSYPLNNFYDRNALIQLRRFTQYLRTHNIELVQTSDFYSNIFGMTAGFLAGVNIRIASRRETGGMRTSSQTYLQRAAYSLAHQIIANSESVRQKLVDEGINKERVTVIYGAVDPDRVKLRANISRSEFLRDVTGAGDLSKQAPRSLVTIVANMRHEVKDYPMFLRAAQRVSQAIPDVGFLLAGEGELQQSLRQQATQLGLNGKTFFLGRVKNIAELLSVSEVCVLSSKAEGFSNSILEYMAAGRPVVATDVGGAREAIVEGETGYTVPSGDDQLMADRIISLLRDPSKAKQMGEQGRLVVEEKFSSRSLLQNTEALYEKLFAARVNTGNIKDQGISPTVRKGFEAN